MFWGGNHKAAVASKISMIVVGASSDCDKKQQDVSVDKEKLLKLRFSDRKAALAM